MGDNMEGDTRTQDAITDQVRTGYNDGSKDGGDAIATQMEQRQRRRLEDDDRHQQRI